MDAPWLREIVRHIKEHTSYKSNEAVAARLGISESTLRGYWSDNQSDGVIPEKNIKRWIEFIQEIVARPVSRAEAKILLKSDAIHLLNRLSPISGAAWAELFRENENNDPLTVENVPFRKGLGFGEMDDDDEPSSARAIVELYQGFFFSPTPKWPGEGALFAEHRGEWRIIQFLKEVRTILFQHGLVTAPERIDGKQGVLKEKEKPGSYRYMFVAVRGKFGEGLKQDLMQANPLSQMGLDLIAGQVMALPAKDRLIQATSIYVTDD